jgi:putative cell wall-binding protein
MKSSNAAGASMKMKSRIVKTLLATVLAFGMGMGMVGYAGADEPPDTPPAEGPPASMIPFFQGICGADRYETAALFEKYIVQPFEPKGVIVVTGESFPDAIAVSSLAGQLGYPVLLASKNTLGSANLKLLGEWPLEHAIIVGGEGAVGTRVAGELAETVPGIRIERISGADRYETARMVYEYGEAIGEGWKRSVAFLVTGGAFPDGCSITLAAAEYAAPVFFTGKGGTIDETSLSRICEYENIIIVGSTAVVSKTTETAVAASGSKVTRLAGNDRYATNLEVVRYFSENLDPDYSYYFAFVQIVSGESFADSLASGTNSGLSYVGEDTVKGAILYINDSTPVNDACRYLAAKYMSHYFLGGPGVISEASRIQIMETISAGKKYIYNELTR